MSRAFVKENDETVAELPDRPVSPYPNLVTAEGLAAIEVQLARLQQEHARASGDRAALAAISVNCDIGPRAEHPLSLLLRRLVPRRFGLVAPSPSCARMTAGKLTVSLARMKPTRRAVPSRTSLQWQGPSWVSRSVISFK